LQCRQVNTSKELRAHPYASQINIGNIAILIKDWTPAFVDEHGLFPKGKYKDQVDAAVGAFNKLNDAGARAGVWGRNKKQDVHKKKAQLNKATMMQGGLKYDMLGNLVSS